MPSQNEKNNTKFLISLMSYEEHSTLINLPNAEAKVTFAKNLRPQLGPDFVDTYEDIKVYISENESEFKAVTVAEFLRNYDDPEFDAAVKEVIDVENLRRFLEELDIDDEPLVLFAFVFAVLDDLELEFDDITRITSLGGNRYTDKADKQIPILKLLNYKEARIADGFKYADDSESENHYDITLLKRSYEELLDNSNFIEVYIKSKKFRRDKSWSLHNRFCLLNRMAEHIEDPFIERIFTEETGGLPGRINARVGDFRKSLVRKLKGSQDSHSCVEELILKLSRYNKSYRQEVQEFYARQEENVYKARSKFEKVLQEIECLERKMLSKNTVDRHLKLMKLLDVSYGVAEYWERMYDDTQSTELKNAIDDFGGRNLNTVYDESLYNDCIKFNSLSDKLDTSLRSYVLVKESFLRTMRKRQRLFGDLEESAISKTFSDIGLLVASPTVRNLSIDGFLRSFLDSVHETSPDASDFVVAAYNSLDLQFYRDLRSEREKNMQDFLSQFSDVGLEYKSSESGVSKKFGLRIRLNPIRFPTPRDIAREIGGVLDSAGNVINDAGNVVVNIFEVVRVGGEQLFGELNKLKYFLEVEGPKFEKYIRRDLGGDIDTAITNIIIKPINWIFCGGRQPSDDQSENGDCFQGGLQCGSDSEGTSCQLTDAQGNPSGTPKPDERITSEQLQWMKQVEQQDLLNSIDFTAHLRTWITDARQVEIFRAVLLRNQSSLSKRIEAGYSEDAQLEAELATEISGQVATVELIQAATNAATEHVLETLVSLINVVETVEEIGAVFDFIGENGALALVGQIGTSLRGYWNEFVVADDIGKAEIIGRVSADVAMSLVPAGAVAKLGKGSIRAAAASSSMRRQSLKFTELVQKRLGNPSGEKLGNLMGEFRRASKKGNFTFSPGTNNEALFLRDCWVGTEGVTIRDYDTRRFPGKKVYVSQDGTRQFREPVRKGDGRIVANFEWRPANRTSERWIGDAHMEITDIQDKIFIYI